MPAMKRELPSSYEEALGRVTEALKSEGFGVLSEIDVKKTLEQKLGVNFRRYKILGACNPPLAHRALGLDIDVGLLMPCNVVVYETGVKSSVVSAIDPVETIASYATGELRDVAATVRAKLERVLERLA